MTPRTTPCAVCGVTDVKLVDGFYFCVECGTQDTTTQHTVVEEETLNNGNLVYGATKRLKKRRTEEVMSEEWYKWQSFNFILCGLTDELIALGAEESFKAKVLWIWSRYVKKYQDKKEYNKNSNLKTNTTFMDNEASDREDEINAASDLTELKDITRITRPLLITILYIALNLDGSDIQLSQLLRYIREQRLSYYSCAKFIPKEFKISVNETFQRFSNFKIPIVTRSSILYIGKKLHEDLNLGTPRVPNLRPILHTFVKELCLPVEFSNLVISLFHYMSIEAALRRSPFQEMLPDFEAVVMAYILIALKMCFGLDDDYDIKLSKVVNKINKNENYIRAYKMDTEKTDRLFSFSDWIEYLEYRKKNLIQYHQPSSFLYSPHDVKISELGEETTKEAKHSRDIIIFETLNKIPLIPNTQKIAKETFPVSFTPWTAYTNHLITKIKDKTVAHHLSEDFSKYSLEYACLKMFLNSPNSSENIICGVDAKNKIYSDRISGLMLIKKKRHVRSVLVSNEENKNWVEDFKKHNEKIFEHADFKFRDEDDWDQTSEMLNELKNDFQKEDIPTHPKKIDELDEGKDIFDYNFDDHDMEIDTNSVSQIDFAPSINSNITDYTIKMKNEHDLKTFNKKDAIKKLMQKAMRDLNLYCHPYEKQFKYQDKPRSIAKKQNCKEEKPQIQTMKADAIAAKFLNIFENEIHNQEETMSDNIYDNFNKTNERQENLPVEPESLIQDSLVNKSDDKMEVEDINEQMKKFIYSTDDLLKYDDIVNNILEEEVKKYKKMKSKQLKALNALVSFKSKINKMNTRKSVDNEVELEPLIQDQHNISEFRYFFRRYVAQTIRTFQYIPRSYKQFEAEIYINLPKSFRYVLQTCSYILESKCIHLYNVLQNIENKFYNIGF